MGRYLITGRPGTGKSEVTRALADRGYNAYDLEDLPGIVRLEVKATGEPTNWPEGYVDWEYYAWNLQGPALEKFLGAQGTKDVFVSVSATNQSQFYHLFDTVFALVVSDPEEHRRRLKNRNVHEYGQTDENIERNIAASTEKTAKYIADGALPIDNMRPLDDVVSEILALAAENIKS